jgi:hypothetical protein
MQLRINIPLLVGTRADRTMRVWLIAFLVAGACASLMILQDVLYRGVDSGAPFSITAAQYLLPWLTWALLAPILLLLFDAFPIDLRRPWRPLAILAVSGILVVGVKLLVSAPLAMLFIWRPLGVSWSDGVSWLLANRAGSNLLIFWGLLCAYTAYRYYQRSTEAGDVVTDNHSYIHRIPVRAGDGTALLALDQVTVIESDRNQSIVLANGSRHVTRALQDLESRLPPERFLRIHRSRIINVDHVTRIEPWGRGDYLIVLVNGDRVLSGKTYRAAVKRLLDICHQ